MEKSLQKIIFGGPGTGKSYKIIKEFLPDLGIKESSENCIHTVFHPDYSYGDFMGKLLPLTKNNKVEYKYHKGDFLKALSQAYKNILDSKIKNIEIQNVVLIIDEINRGNASAIFGKVFQLLDRNNDYWSSYKVNISRMEFDELIESAGIKFNENGVIDNRQVKWWFENKEIKVNEIIELLDNQQIRIPNNLSIISTMNTSDNSVFYMDSAFKRRWDWEFVNVKENKREGVLIKTKKNKDYDWMSFIDKLNKFIEQNHEYVRDVDSKQIGYWFIKDSIITEEQVKNKIMFFLWDSVFVNSKKPLEKLLDIKELVTFSNFYIDSDKFIEAIFKINV